MSLKYLNSKSIKTAHNLCILLFICSSIKSSTTQNKSCEDLEPNQKCSECIKIPNCFWCSDPAFEDSNNSNYYNYSRCNTYEKHSENGCDKSHIIIKDLISNITYKKNDPVTLGDEKTSTPRIKLQPQIIELKLRVGESKEITVNYLESNEKTLDVYFLMDLSTTMKADKEMVADLSDGIYSKLSNLTSKEVRFGFGSFIDKPMVPFVYVDQLLHPKEGILIPYSFKNHVRMTSNISIFRDSVRNVGISTNADAPEGGLDALYQAIKCVDQIGWGNVDTRLLVLATDGPFHIAGDGKLAGILLHHDGECHLENKTDGSATHFFDGTKMDYPTLSQLSNIISLNGVYVIFAVDKKYKSEYDLIKSRIKNSEVVVLEANSSNINNIIEEKYKEIRSNVSLDWIIKNIKDGESGNNIEVFISSKCSKNEGFSQKNNCNITTTDKEYNATFKVNITAKDCGHSNEYNLTISTYSTNDSILQVNVKVLCKCHKCEAEEKENINRTETCNGKGKLVCGKCLCDGNYDSRHCECKKNREQEEITKHCFNITNDENDFSKGKLEKRCSRNGKCICNKCVCNDDRYTGTYCQFNSDECKKDGIECSENGKCQKGSCSCSMKNGTYVYEGKFCECLVDKEPCKFLGETRDCSGNGNCTCKKGTKKSCECNKGFIGDHCEASANEKEKSILVCNNSTVKECLRCHLNNNEKNENNSCSTACMFNNNNNTKITVNKPESIVKNCFLERENCKNYFNYKYDKVLSLEYSDKECIEVADPFWIIVGVVGSIVLIGIISLLIWKIATSFYDKKEYEKFERERTDTRFAPGENPLYKGPSSSFANPMFSEK